MSIPANLKYTAEHEWIKIEGNTGIIGITEYAQGELGDVVYVDIAADLEGISKGETFGTIEAVKTVSDLYAPCSGKVIEVNPKLQDQAELINSDPYGEGWLIKVEIADSSELDDLMTDGDYAKHIGQ
ncbi:MAG: glycine cleavage system protein GcvH [Ignavibacteriales bacterium]|nr:glycine cleavage system protein GcvH [Ignavibacteriales bacterium]MCF8316086.1 glycine cleavage system protein GcvH [Ignavibacteriales bacterium]MCF8436588.1 glycine cleavage system protein GcvH [Ignavibacteriales bacterium]